MTRRQRAEAVAADWVGEMNPARLADALVDFADAEVAQAEADLARVRADVAHRIRLIFKDSEIFYKVREIKACLDLADELEARAALEGWGMTFRRCAIAVLVGWSMWISADGYQWRWAAHFQSEGACRFAIPVLRDRYALCVEDGKKYTGPIPPLEPNP